MKHIFKKVYIIFPLLFSIIFLGCGAENPAAPATAVITINPSSFELATASTLPVTYRTEYFTITVFQDAARTKPMSDVTITIDYVFASPAERYYVQFYHDGERVQSPLTVKTDNYGTYVLRVDFLSGGGNAYTGDINVRSGAAFKSATFAVTSS